MSSISVALATFNEEKNLPDCLDSVKDFADEIVIVDGSSSDSTVEIAKKHNAVVVITNNPPIFHINKQKAIDMATKDWILQLDADERVSPELRKEIQAIINDKKNKLDGFWIPRKNWFLGKFLMKGGQYPDYSIRLYRRGKGRLPQVDVHEQAVVDGEVGHLKNPLIHIADPEFKRYLTRFGRYTTLSAAELRKKKNKNILTPINYLVLKPITWFFLTYFRHKGFMDSWQGFIFSLFSAMHFPVSYIKSLTKNEN